jgi:pimeloyl-ACP methyl ester carboxylesterase
MRLSRRVGWGIAAATLLLAGSAAFAIYFSNAQQPAPEAVAALQSSPAVTVTEGGDQIVFMPKQDPEAAIIFYPGARVEAAAYAARLRPLAEHGYAVFIVEFPLHLAFFGADRAAGVMAAHPEIQTWAIGGHSLGGAFACSFLAGRKDIKGLILYASYPAVDLSKRTELVAVSLYGTNDGLATVDRIEKARPTMPPQTQYVAIEGGNHSYFGDYGMQAGDGLPTISREAAARQIAAATLAAMDEVAGR